MTIPALSPQEPAKRSKRLYVYWGAALALLLTVGLACWQMVLPYFRARTAAERCMDLSGSPLLEQARAEVSRLGGPHAAARQLTFYLRLPRSMAPNREMAAYLLGHCGLEGLAECLRVFADKDEAAGVRMWAASGLAEIGDCRAADVLVAALRDKDGGVRYHAAYALGVIRDRRAIRPLIAALKDGDSRVRANAAKALGAIGGAQAVEPIMVVLTDSDWVARCYAAEALQQIGDPKAVQSLQAALRDERESVRRAAATALKKIRAADKKEDARR